jgi:hypothetical protein
MLLPIPPLPQFVLVDGEWHYHAIGRMKHPNILPLSETFSWRKTIGSVAQAYYLEVARNLFNNLPPSSDKPLKHFNGRFKTKERIQQAIGIAEGKANLWHFFAKHGDDPETHGTFEFCHEEIYLHQENPFPACYKAWLLDHSRNLDAMLANLMKRWLKKGGGKDQWETINKAAINQSGYAKAISKEAKEMIAYQTKPKEIIKPKAKPFNGLDISKIKL